MAQVELMQSLSLGVCGIVLGRVICCVLPLLGHICRNLLLPLHVQGASTSAAGAGPSASVNVSAGPSEAGTAAPTQSEPQQVCRHCYTSPTVAEWQWCFWHFCKMLHHRSKTGQRGCAPSGSDHAGHASAERQQRCRSHCGY